MVCRLTIGKNTNVTVQIELESVLIKSEKLRSKFAGLIDEDTEAFKRVMAAYKLPKETGEQNAQRAAVVQDAIKTATMVPLKLMELCAEAITLLKIVVEKGNKNALSDAGVAALMISAASEGAALNVQINLGSIKDTAFVELNKTAANTLRATVSDSSQQTLYRINEKLLSF
jgi:methenyltetrahydrofolate cyclohydrolase